MRAARFHGVNEPVLRAIAFHESSMKSREIRRNTNGSHDIGLMQINTVHLAELAKHGIGPAHLQDGCVRNKNFSERCKRDCPHSLPERESLVPVIEHDAGHEVFASMGL